MNKLSFAFTSEYCNAWPRLRFMIDRDVYLEHNITQSKEIIDIPIDLIDGTHMLEIERYGKSDADNLIYKDNKILKDQLITLDEIYLDGLKIPDWFKYNGKFCYDNISIDSALTWGPNGIWSVQFETPLLEWIIHIKRLNESKTNVLDLVNYKDKQTLINQLVNFERELINAREI